MPRFVVQEHHATRLHWDFRLEHEGVAVSWAVPKGLPEEPGPRRLAVHVDDHSVSYMAWSGTIGRGSYGAGKVLIWDAGDYELEKWEEDKIVVVLHGDRLEGRYALIHTGDENWLIQKTR
ncbi:MAG: DNA polymerase ligase N-terminal domain-containing protein [Thermoleophilaceae bacterium]